MTEMTVVRYNEQEHEDRLVTPEEWERFLAALPDDARAAMRPDEPPTDLKLWAVVEEIRNFMFDYVYKCQRRPALPHEREDSGCGWYLTKKGTAKYNAHLCDVSRAFEQAFGLRPWRRYDDDPVMGPLDPLLYE